MRIYELAKKWGLDSKEFVAQLKAMGYDVKNHMSTLDDELIQRIERKIFPESSKKETLKSVPKTAPEPSKKTEKKEPVKVSEKVAEKKSLSAAEESAPQDEEPAVVDIKGPYHIDFPITVGGLAEVTEINVATMIKTLMSIGIFANVNQLLSKSEVFP